MQERLLEGEKAAQDEAHRAAAVDKEVSAVMAALLSRLRDDALQFEAGGESVRQRVNQQQVAGTHPRILCYVSLLYPISRVFNARKHAFFAPGAGLKQQTLNHPVAYSLEAAEKAVGETALRPEPEALIGMVSCILPTYQIN